MWEGLADTGYIKMERRDFKVEKLGPCVVITMDLGENRLNSNFCRAMNKALDEAERLRLVELASL